MGLLGCDAGQEAVNQEAKLVELQNRLAWCDVEEVEAKVDEIEKKLKVEEPKIGGYLDKIKEWEGEKSTADRDIEDLTAAQDDVQKQIKEKKDMTADAVLVMCSKRKAAQHCGSGPCAVFGFLVHVSDCKSEPL